MHSYGFIHISLKSTQEDEAHIKMSSMRDLFQFLNRSSFVWGGLLTVSAAQFCFDTDTHILQIHKLRL